MSVVHSFLVVLAALVLGLSFAVPVEDVPETLYDESETLPYESTPPFSIVQQESALAPRLEFPPSSSAKLNAKCPPSRRSAKRIPSAIQSSSSITRFAVKDSTTPNALHVQPQACVAQGSVTSSNRTPMPFSASAPVWTGRTSVVPRPGLAMTARLWSGTGP